MKEKLREILEQYLGLIKPGQPQKNVLGTTEVIDAILELVKEAIPEEADDEYDEGNAGWNACRNRIIKNLGLEE